MPKGPQLLLSLPGPGPRPPWSHVLTAPASGILSETHLAQLHQALVGFLYKDISLGSFGTQQ